MKTARWLFATVPLTLASLGGGGTLPSVSVEIKRQGERSNVIEYTYLVDNCDSSTDLQKSFEDKSKITQVLTVTNGWKVMPGLSVAVPNFGTVSLGTELSRTYGSSTSLEHETSTKLTQIVRAKLQKNFRVRIEETIATGQATVKKGVWPFDKSSTANFHFVTKRTFTIDSDEYSCTYGDWELVSWTEQAGRSGLGDHLGIPQSRFVHSGTLTVDEVGAANWSVRILPPGVNWPVWVEGRGPIQDGRVSNPQVGVRHGVGSGQIPDKMENEFLYALTGKALSHSRGQLLHAPFSLNVDTSARERTLHMRNSEGLLIWRRAPR